MRSRSRMSRALARWMALPVTILCALAGASPALATARTPARVPAYSTACARGSGCVAVERAVVPAAFASAPFDAAPAANAGTFTWSGANNTPNWSAGANWAGGVAPAGTVGTLSFPLLTGSVCTACYSSLNDVKGVGTGGLTVDDGGPYEIQGDAITLGAGGLTASTATTGFNTTPPQLRLPIGLTASQTWSLDGNNNDNQLGLDAAVSGSSDAVTVELNHQTFLGINFSDVEVGPVTITGTTTGIGGSVALSSGAALNGGNGHSVTLTGTGTGIFASGNARIGALTANAGNVQVGNGISGAARLSVSGGAALESGTSLTLNVIKPGTAAATDYSQLSATAPVSIAGTLQLNGATTLNRALVCPTLHVGDVDTLVKTTGALTGTFANAADGATLQMFCPGGVEPTVRINYTTQTVTATVLTAGGANTVKSVLPNAGQVSGGNTVTINGTNFVSPATVDFGTTAGTSVVVDSPTKLTVVAPAHASGVVDVTVTSARATSPRASNDLYAFGPPTVTSFTPTSGITGSSVAISGTNFVPRARVKFGSLASPSVQFVSPTELTAVVPNGAVPGKIAVITPAGSGLSSATFSPTLSITSFSPSSGAVGTPVTINGTGFNSSSTVAFNGVAAAVTSESPTQLQTMVPAGATSGPITVTNTASPTGTVSSATSFTVT